MTRAYFIGALAVVIVAAACRGGDGTADAVGSRASETVPGMVVDSALPMDTLMRRFQTGLERPARFWHAATSKEALTRSYLEALARSDTAALREMHISRSEYAYLYFPESKMTKPPYELSPEVAWILLSSESNKGLTSILRRFAGRQFSFEGVDCGGEPLREGANIVWRDCVVRHRDDQGVRAELPLFAAIIEREGRYKFFSYATTL